MKNFSYLLTAGVFSSMMKKKEDTKKSSFSDKPMDGLMLGTEESPIVDSDEEEVKAWSFLSLFLGFWYSFKIPDPQQIRKDFEVEDIFEHFSVSADFADVNPFDMSTILTNLRKEKGGAKYVDMWEKFEEGILNVAETVGSDVQSLKKDRKAMYEYYFSTWGEIVSENEGVFPLLEDEDEDDEGNEQKKGVVELEEVQPTDTANPKNAPKGSYTLNEVNDMHESLKEMLGVAEANKWKNNIANKNNQIIGAVKRLINIKAGAKDPKTGKPFAYTKAARSLESQMKRAYEILDRKDQKVTGKSEGGKTDLKESPAKTKVNAITKQKLPQSLASIVQFIIEYPTNGQVQKLLESSGNVFLYRNDIPEATWIALENIANTVDALNSATK